MCGGYEKGVMCGKPVLLGRFRMRLEGVMEIRKRSSKFGGWKHTHVRITRLEKHCQACAYLAGSRRLLALLWGTLNVSNNSLLKSLSLDSFSRFNEHLCLNSLE